MSLMPFSLTELNYREKFSLRTVPIPRCFLSVLVRKDQWTLRTRRRASGETGGPLHTCSTCSVAPYTGVTFTCRDGLFSHPSRGDL